MSDTRTMLATMLEMRQAKEKEFADFYDNEMKPFMKMFSDYRPPWALEASELVGRRAGSIISNIIRVLPENKPLPLAEIKPLCEGIRCRNGNPLGPEYLVKCLVDLRNSVVDGFKLEIAGRPRSYTYKKVRVKA